ncbi:hypothetical protein [Pandoraea pnomenusa]|uniref:hypothetical protein n=1 Tax=Pandoraea pnomenusa TaxID=93220 RepID=UPI00333F6E1F
MMDNSIDARRPNGKRLWTHRLIGNVQSPDLRSARDALPAGATAFTRTDNYIGFCLSNEQPTKLLGIRTKSENIGWGRLTGAIRVPRNPENFGAKIMVK